MFDDEDMDSAEEIEIRITPRDEDLEARGISQDEFDDALMTAIDSWEANDHADESPLEDRVINIQGSSYRLGDLADIEMSGPLEKMDEDEGDE